MSKVVSNDHHKVKFPLNEPATAKWKSRTDEYLESHTGPGCQHIALAVADIVATIENLERYGILARFREGGISRPFSKRSSASGNAGGTGRS